MEHILKIRSNYFTDLITGLKNFEIRKNDRPYSIGDRLILFEVDETGKETGKSVSVRVTYILTGPVYGLAEGYCIMSIKLSKRQARTNSGNRPKSEQEVLEYAQSIGLDKLVAMDCFNYYTQTGWKMASGLPLADWKAAFRRWKPRIGQVADDSEYQKLSLLLPLLLQRTAQLAQSKIDVRFRDQHVGAVALHYGLDRLLKPMNAYETKAMVQLYLTSRKTKLMVPSMRSNPHGQGTLIAPTIDEFQTIMKNKAEQ